MINFMLIAVIGIWGAEVEHELRSYNSKFECLENAHIMYNILKEGVTNEGTKVYFKCDRRETDRVKI